MSLISANNLGVSFGDFDLFRGVSVNIAHDSRVGLIGPNGIGKTTLLLILAGINLPTTGKVYMARGQRLGYLRQEAVDAFVDRQHTVYSEMQSVFEHLHQQQDYLHTLEARMAQGDPDERLLEEYGQAQHAFEEAGGYEYDVRIRQTLQGLGLGEEFWQMPLGHLSGGQKTRALLARLLLEQPDLLMLDEPTNHLDMEAVEWLENTLKDWKGAVVIVSHDRYFLDNTVNVIWEMHPDGIETYPGNYTSYLMERETRWDYYERVYKEEKERLLKEVDFIQRNWVRASTHARALGRLRQISRDLAIVENHGIMALRSGKSWSEMDLHVERRLEVIDAIRKVNAIKMPNRKPRHIKPRIQADSSGGTLVMRTHDLHVGYPGNHLFSSDKIELRRGECAVLVGPNGSGKTTLLKMVMGELQPLAGEIELGNGVKTGYFAQAHDNFDPANTVLDELTLQHPMQPETARNHLAHYLFQGDDVFKPVGALSGGERARLALAILAAEGANFLVLDEPTNHLDIPAQEVLQETLEDFAGTILLVTHDRYLINRLATQIWTINDDHLDAFKGSYRDYVLTQSKPTGMKTERQILLPNKPVIKLDSREARKKAEMLAQLEARIHELEKEIKQATRDLQKAGTKGDYELVQRLSQQLAEDHAELDELMLKWEQTAA